MEYAPKAVLMTHDEHRERHKMLHKYLDELVADWITHADSLPSKNSVMDLMDWSYEQTLNPTEKS